MKCKQILSTYTIGTGLEIKPNTPKNMRMNSTRDASPSQQTEDIDKFIYVGSVVSRTEGSEKESELLKNAMPTTHLGSSGSTKTSTPKPNSSSSTEI